jgi:DNA/RNA endonuclease YhcR with UshA esterase domain
MINRSPVRFLKSLSIVCALSVVIGCSESQQPRKENNQSDSTPSVVSVTLTPTAPVATWSPVPTRHVDTKTFDGDIGQLGSEWIGERVSLSGRVVEPGSIPRGFTFVLEDSTGSIVLLAWDQVYDAIADRDSLHYGSLVQVTGTVGTYEGQLQIVPATGSDVSILAQPDSQSERRQTGSISPSDLGIWATIEGQIISLKPFSSGMRVYVDDGSGELQVLLWQNVLDRVRGGAQALVAGGRVRVSGHIAEYQSALEIVPAVPVDVEILEHTIQTPSAASPITQISDINATQLGKQVSTAGQVAAATSFSSGFKFSLTDGANQITLILWHRIYDALPQAALLNVGAEVEITGWITEYDGELQLEPLTADDITVTSRPQSIPPVRNIAAMANYLGERIAIAGTVAEANEISSGARIIVSDQTGQAQVFIWNNILERIPNNQLLGRAGTPVRIVGTVQRYQGALELLPALPYDIEVVSP